MTGRSRAYLDLSTMVAPVPVARRASLWLLTAAMVLIIGLKSHPAPIAGIPWHVPGWLALAAGLGLAWWREPDSRWARTTVLLAWTIGILFLTRIDGDTTDAHTATLMARNAAGGFAAVSRMT